MSEQPLKSPTPLEALLQRAAREPHRVALITGDERWACSHLVQESARVADGFRLRGVCPGDRVVLHMPNKAELALAYLACWQSGAIAVPLNLRYKPLEVAAMIERVRPALYLGQDDLCAGLRHVSAEALAFDARFVVSAGAVPDGAQPWAALMGAVQDRPRASEIPPVDHGAPAVLLSTSGTTGPSKLVVWMQQTMAAFATSAEGRGFGLDDVIALAAPMVHSSGAYSFASCLLTGAVAVLLPRFEAVATLDAIAAHRCTTIPGLPTMYAELARHQKEQPRDVSSVLWAVSAGDVCPAETERAFAEAFPCCLLSFWASTEETGAFVPGLEPGPLTRPLPGTEIRLVDESGGAVATDRAGELLVRSPSTTPGYWNRANQLDPLPDGWLHTGDLMRCEPDGQMRFMGRLKELIVRGGSNISPVDVENVLRREPGMADAAVAGLPDPELGERVGAVLVLAPGATDEDVPDIIVGARRALADYKMPERVAVVEAIPQNALTKVDRREVAQIVANRGKVV